MRFKTNLKNVRTFSKLVAALSSLEKIAWMRLDDDHVRFTVIPDTGSQVWAMLGMDFIFDGCQLQSAEPKNTINLELPLGSLQRALRSALSAESTSLRLTKKDGVPVLSMTITATTSSDGMPNSSSRFAARMGGAASNSSNTRGAAHRDDDDDDDNGIFAAEPLETSLYREREKIITQDIPVRVLHPAHVEAIMQPKVRDPDVHIQLPPLLQLKAFSDRFTKLAVASQHSVVSGASSSSSAANAAAAATAAALSGSSGYSPKLVLSANMHGGLRLGIATDTLDVESTWDGLENPELDPAQLGCALEDHPSTKFRNDGPERWASVRVDGRDWSRVLSVGRLDGRVIACFCHDHALILYVYVPHDDPGADDSTVTVGQYYVSSYSA